MVVREGNLRCCVKKTWSLVAFEGWSFARGNFTLETLNASGFWPDEAGGRRRGDRIRGGLLYYFCKIIHKILFIFI